MRAAVMAAIHFDFLSAQEHSSLSETAFNYNEDQTTMLNFGNLLFQLKELATEQSKQPAKDTLLNKIT